MEIRSVSCVCFSPTGTTRTVIENIAKGMGAESIEMVDCTLRSKRNGKIPDFNTDMVIIGAPVYYGRIPEEVVPFLKTLSGQNIPAVPVVVYGNREYEDALIELRDICESRGFIPVAGGAFVGEHSYSFSSRPIAHGRPDADDINKAQAFGDEIREKLNGMDVLGDMEKVNVPGNVPYLVPEHLNMIKEVRLTLAFTPETDADKCTQCGVCAEICPTQSIDPDDVSKIDRWECIICFACIKNCPSQAKEMMDPNFNQAIGQLQAACQTRKEPETYL